MLRNNTILRKMFKKNFVQKNLKHNWKRTKFLEKYSTKTELEKNESLNSLTSINEIESIDLSENTILHKLSTRIQKRKEHSVIQWGQYITHRWKERERKREKIKNVVCD